jgi:ABC-type multidrug transport system ATPase subunit
VVGQLYEQVAALATEGVTVVLSEQFVRTALAIATRAAIVVGGRVESVGAPGEIAERALETYLADDTAGSKGIDGSAGIDRPAAFDGPTGVVDPDAP